MEAYTILNGIFFKNLDRNMTVNWLWNIRNFITRIHFVRYLFLSRFEGDKHLYINIIQPEHERGIVVKIHSLQLFIKGR